MMIPFYILRILRIFVPSAVDLHTGKYSAQCSFILIFLLDLVCIYVYICKTCKYREPTWLNWQIFKVGRNNSNKCCKGIIKGYFFFTKNRTFPWKIWQFYYRGFVYSIHPVLHREDRGEMERNTPYPNHAGRPADGLIDYSVVLRV